MNAYEGNRAFWNHNLNRLDSYLKEIISQEKSTSESAISNRQLSMTRIYNASPALVFDVYTKPEHLKKWFGCAEMPLVECEIDLRVGGSYRFVTKGGGHECPLNGEYFEVVRPEKLVYSQIFDVEPYSSCVAMVTTTFRDLGGKTELTSTIVFPDEETYTGAMASGMEAGMGLALDRLGEVVSNQN